MMHSSVHATSSAPNSDTDSPMVPGGGDKQMERGDRQGEYGDVDDEDMERANTGWVTSVSTQHGMNASEACMQLLLQVGCRYCLKSRLPACRCRFKICCSYRHCMNMYFSLSSADTP